ncbi:type I-E CRISPR-associated protein Cse2/CasB [Motiliproteus sp. MSK22-1]|nr:type I-E CRISPR-associated protein Cse2/CasB [Motiliproteus sp. MSK22-1]
MLRLKEKDLSVLVDWWQSLDGDRRSRARLRRATSLDDILLQEAFFRFLSYRMEVNGKQIGLGAEWSQADNLHAAALICGLLARVKGRSTDTIKSEQLNNNKDGLEKKEKQATFAAQLAMPGKGERPLMNELRFQRLQKSHDLEEFFLQMCRAIDLLSGIVHLESLIEDTLHWHQEHYYGADKNPRRRLAVRWATDYFSTLNHFKLA